MSDTRHAGCTLTTIPWIRTSTGPMTVRDALLAAHYTDGLDPRLNGIQTGAQLRYLTAVTALVIRHQGRPGKSFSTEAVDRALALIAPHSNVLDPDRPFLQIPAGNTPPKAGKEFPVKKLLPWMPADRAEDFWSDGVHPDRLDAADAVLALAVHHHYSFGGNNKIEGRSCANGSPGIRYPGVGYTATEVLWQGGNLFETLLLNTPSSWVDGTGLPAWADPSCKVSGNGAGKPEHPLWRATWGSNTAMCAWEGTTLTAVTTGGSTHRPPSMGDSKVAAKAWWDTRNTEDTFYLYVDIEKKTAKGIVQSVERKAQRLDFGHSTTDLAVEWNSKNLSSAVQSRSKKMVRTPDDEQIMFLRHLVEGSASSPVVRRTEVLVSSPKKWIIDEDRADAVSFASQLVKAVCSEVCKPFTDKGRLTAIRDRRPDIETAFWQKVAKPFEQFIISGTGDSIDPAVWPAVRTAALAAFDEVTSSAPASKLAPFIMTARNRVAWNITQALGLAPQKAGTK
ncbi:MAG TPA: type I-E CRISPR-associated protein Cse1/CasA [Arthrobacter sp.]